MFLWVLVEECARVSGVIGLRRVGWSPRDQTVLPQLELPQREVLLVVLAEFEIARPVEVLLVVVECHWRLDGQAKVDEYPWAASS